MATVVDYGPDGSGIVGVTAVTHPVQVLNFVADFATIEDVPGQVTITDITAPADRPSKIRIAQRERTNVYAGTSIDSGVFLPNKRGTDTLVEVTEVWEGTDTVLTDVLYHFPVRCAVSFTVPATEYVTSTEVSALIARTLAAALKVQDADGTADLSGLEALLHGSLVK